MTKFEGTVNGRKFDNVKDYNECLTEVLRTGAVVEATSRTYTEPDVELEIKQEPLTDGRFTHPDMILKTEEDCEDIENFNEELSAYLDQITDKDDEELQYVLAGLTWTKQQEEEYQDSQNQMKEDLKELELLVHINKLGIMHNDRIRRILQEQTRSCDECQCVQPCDYHKDPAGDRGPQGTEICPKEILNNLDNALKMLATIFK